MISAFPIAIDVERGKCGLCPAICCGYITQKIPTPRARSDFEHLLWQISHKNIETYKDEDGWFLLIRSPCEHLRDDGGCGIYETRPSICRDYSNEFCELDDSAERHFALHFRDHGELLRYCEKRFRKWHKEG